MPSRNSSLSSSAAIPARARRHGVSASLKTMWQVSFSRPGWVGRPDLAVVGSAEDAVAGLARFKHEAAPTDSRGYRVFDVIALVEQQAEGEPRVGVGVLRVGCGVSVLWVGGAEHIGHMARDHTVQQPPQQLRRW